MPRESFRHGGSLRALDRLLPLALAATVALTGCEAGGGDSSATSVTMFRGGSDHLGVSAGPAGAAYGGLLWRVRTGGPVRSSPVVAGGVLFVGSSDGRLRALDARTGELRWAADAGAPIDAAAAVAGELVLAATRAGEFLAFDRATGEVRWRVRSGAEQPLAWEGMSGDLYTASPAVAGDVAVFGGGDGVVYAIDLADGEVRWRFATEGRVRSSPAVADGVVYAGSADGSLYTIALADGRLLWRFDTEGRQLDSSLFGYDRRTITSSPAVAGGAVFFGSRDGSLYAVDAETGALRWRVLHDDTSWSIASPAVVDWLVLDASSDAGFFHAVDAVTGRVVWRVDVGAPLWPSPVVAGDTAWFLTSLGELWGVDPRTGAVRERVQLGVRTKSSPWIEDGALYMGTDERYVLAVRLVDPPGLARAVYWDAATEELNGVAGSEAVRDFFAAGGRLARGFPRGADRRPRAGGRRVRARPAAGEACLGQREQPRRRRALPPLAGRRRQGGLARASAARLARGARRARVLDDRPRGDPAAPRRRPFPAFFDGFGATVTDAGRRWGLEEGWLSRWSADTAGVEALALDENGHAAAWVKSYGGPPGSGFVRLEADGRDPQRLALVAAAAEGFPDHEE
ncbi:MAG TPA: PQQ-binding-like beta-propeller repeat protein [Gemmatimonadota bacterium]|nr:PQQ-binding-like beta-propeller repeat protein [Gemmatimonadota bacterium]